MLAKGVPGAHNQRMARGFWRDSRWAAIVRALVLVLALPVLLGPALPFFARLAAGPRAHVCHCDARHTDCACPICFPDRDDLQKSELAVSAPCGDEDPVFSCATAPVIFAAPSAAVFAAPVSLVSPIAPSTLESRGPSPPDPPPPRA